MPSVLVTGAARGIGRATALRLAAAGWDVVAGVRRDEDGQALSAAGEGRIVSVPLDITDADQLASLSDALPGSLDAVVNNAGIVVGGPIEGVPLDDLRHQLEVNVVGQVAVTQAVMPRLRASRGRVVFVSSLSGRVSTPMSGPYNASKFALEGLADALRMEVKPWGVRVVLVEPAQTDTDIWRDAESALEGLADALRMELWPWGVRVVLVEPAQTDTDMWRTAEAEFDATLATISEEHRNLYAKHIEGFRRSIPRSQKMASPVAGVTAAIERALTTSRPKARYVVGAGPRVQALLAG
ncbi:MAG: hypothetical protein QOC95_2507, partial [Thermoleophilaceae bacterium]|nr:hypothetical protein [Thermoleophilaceae bacterium]